jgi:hypothetical protein
MRPELPELQLMRRQGTVTVMGYQQQNMHGVTDVSIL